MDSTDHPEPDPNGTPGGDAEPALDCRLYVPEAENWQARILTSWEKVYCFSKNPGQDYYHLILHGEIYLQKGDEVYCLSCARRDGVATHDRLYWQKRTGF
ncbi:hypothetical protein SH661x_003587 [Planctomicrobium sp. SH661]|uniref:hypothetical protein n=1 Tax=Planctomicrobium sp. SH661 TaxID=3448124 RepID=UPI003F5BFE15